MKKPLCWIGGLPGQIEIQNHGNTLSFKSIDFGRVATVGRGQ